MRLTCFGDCLAPAVPEGTTIEIAPRRDEEIRCGELVVFGFRSTLTCHRVLYRKKVDGLWWFFLKADNTGVADGWIPYYRILGGVIRVGAEERPTTASRRDDLYRLWKSRAGLAVATARFAVRAWTPGVSVG